MDTQQVACPKKRLAKLYVARQELENSLLYFIASIVFSFVLYFIIIEWAKIDAKQSSIIVYLLEAFIAYNCLCFLWRLFKYRDVVMLQHSEVRQSRCQCSKKQKLHYLFFASYIVTPTSHTKGRLEITCPHCRKLIYNCDIEQEGNFDCNIE